MHGHSKDRSTYFPEHSDLTAIGSSVGEHEAAALPASQKTSTTADAGHELS
jgi:hypothetical protein